VVPVLQYRASDEASRVDPQSPVTAVLCGVGIHAVWTTRHQDCHPPQRLSPQFWGASIRSSPCHHFREKGVGSVCRTEAGKYAFLPKRGDVRLAENAWWDCPSYG